MQMATVSGDDAETSDLAANRPSLGRREKAKMIGTIQIVLRGLDHQYIRMANPIEGSAKGGNPAWAGQSGVFNRLPTLYNRSNWLRQQPPTLNLSCQNGDHGRI